MRGKQKYIIFVARCRNDFTGSGNYAQMAELVDALVSGTSIRKYVQVRVLFWAQQTGRLEGRVFHAPSDHSQPEAVIKYFKMPRW